MFSARLGDLRRTTSFRLGLLFASWFGATSLLLFGFSYWRTSEFVSREIDTWLLRVIVARATTPVPDMERELNFRVAADFDGRSPIALFASNGNGIAGVHVRLPASLPPMDQPVNLTLQSIEGE